MCNYLINCLQASLDGKYHEGRDHICLHLCSHARDMVGSLLIYLEQMNEVEVGASLFWEQRKKSERGQNPGFSVLGQAWGSHIDGLLGQSSVL